MANGSFAGHVPINLDVVRRIRERRRGFLAVEKIGNSDLIQSVTAKEFVISEMPNITQNRHRLATGNVEGVGTVDRFNVFKRLNAEIDLG
jgi:hypothetical protein